MLDGGTFAFFILAKSGVWADSDRLLAIWASLDIQHYQWIRTNSGFHINYENSQTPVIIIVSALIKHDCPAAVVGTFAFH